MGNCFGLVKLGFGSTVTHTVNFKHIRCFWKKVGIQAQDFCSGSNRWIHQTMVDLLCVLPGSAKHSCPRNGMDLDALYIRAADKKFIHPRQTMSVPDAP
jgi:hypothetical protein